MKLYLIFTFALLLLWVPLKAQTPAERAVDDLIKAEMQRQKIPGVGLAVVRNGKPFIVKGYGFANIEHQAPVIPETIFQSGSVGKQFTAMAVMILVEEGKISLDETIGKYLGKVPNAWANITVRNLLSHTGGMTDYPENFDFRKDYTEDELLMQAEQVPLAFQPGEKWSYSNLGYVTLGILIGKVSGKFYGDFLSERVFKPLGMQTARIISERDIVPNRAAGYVLVDGEVKNQRWVSPSMNTTADGSLYLSLLDMLKWENGLASGKLLTPASYRQLWSPIKLKGGKEYPYGFGWGFRVLNGKRVIEHGGAWQGFRSHIARYPDNDLAVIVFANLASANVERIASRLSALIDRTLEPKPVVDADPKLSAEFRRILEDILKGNVDASRFTPELAKALSNSEDRFLNHLKKSGPIRGFKLIETRKIDDTMGYRYDVEFDSITALLEIGMQKDRKISHFSLQPE